ncbi:MAG: copper chaperone PCu(A)C [Nitrincola sp.]|nr:copper chaperone PCu(A)C [Nitrincola sp.]
MRKLLLASALVFSSFSFANEAIIIEEPFARAVPPGQPNSAAFMTLKNESSDIVRIISATSNVSEVTELHTHTEVDGVMQMRQIDAIEIPADGMTELKPGGLHVMLIGLTQNLAEGDTVEVTLNFEDGSDRLLEVPVKHVMPMMQHQHKH